MLAKRFWDGGGGRGAGDRSKGRNSTAVVDYLAYNGTGPKKERC